MLKFSVQKSAAEIKTIFLGRWRVKYSFPIELTTSCWGYSKLLLEAWHSCREATENKRQEGNGGRGII